jgi:hypothetical protein
LEKQVWRRFGRCGPCRGRLQGQDAALAAAAHPGAYLASFVTVSQVRVVMSLPKVFWRSVMKTGPFGLGT